MYTLKKSLGQHFLVDETVSERLVESIKRYPVKNLLEIGPGGGALTKYLLKWPGINLKCVEIDAEKVDWLLRTFPDLSGRIIHGDILGIQQPFEEPFVVVGNFPYNISTEILFRMLEWKKNLQGVIGMFQKEVAERVAAKEGSKVYGVTSVLTQAYFRVEYLITVDETAFKPPPKVKSAVIALTPRSDVLPMKSERAFSVLVKAAFNQRRKTLRNAVKPLFEPGTLEQDIFTKRAEQLSVENFAALTFNMK